LKTLLTLVLVLSLSPAAAAAPPDVKAIADAMDRRYNNLRSLRAEFTEIYRGAGVERTESGTLWLKRPGKMRWEYRRPREKLFLADGKHAWFYVPGERQARKAPLKKLDDLRSPLRYLLGKTRLGKELTGLSLAPDVAPLEAGNTVLRGVPKGMEDRISDVVMEVTPEGRIVRLVIHEVDGATTDFRFRNLVDNPPVADAQFQFTPPPGVELVEGAVSF